MNKFEAVPREPAVKRRQIGEMAARAFAQRLQRAYQPVTDARPEFDRALSKLEHRSNLAARKLATKVASSKRRRAV